MKEEVKVPSVGESIVEGVLMAWIKENGEYVREDEDLYEFETEKANVTVPSPFSGVLEIIIPAGTKIAIGQVVATIDTGAARPEQHTAKSETSDPSAQSAAAQEEAAQKTRGGAKSAGTSALSPAVRRIVEEENLDPSTIQGTGRDGRIKKEDALAAAARKTAGEDEPVNRTEEKSSGDGPVRRVAMTPMRAAIAKRLVAARREAAHLTTFNEINMEALMTMRKKHQDLFEKKHGIKLGFMSFFVKASVEALKEFPAVNGRIEGDEIVYYDFYDIGVAVATDRGLLVPVIRNADALSFADIEKKISDLAERAKNKKILLPELQGGTFSITNGGIFGSLMSTPIPNHPQPAILGMHAIKDRPVAVMGEVRIKPMMYVALTYDHRLIDGREAVSFLVRIKEYIEDPDELLLEQ